VQSFSNLREGTLNYLVSTCYMHMGAILFIRSIAQMYGDSVAMEREFCGGCVERGVSKAQDDADIPARHRADQRQDDDHDDGDEGQYQEESHFLG
jgi:hypothetical protein